MFSILGPETIKTKNYCPNPIVAHGIPIYADAIRNPDCVGTRAYEEFWEEQLYRIINGYTTGGIFIPGRYYKYANFDRAQTVKGAGPMELHDFQLDFALWVDDIKRRGKNGFIPKSRRKTVSTMGNGMITDYGLRFQEEYKAAVVGGFKNYCEDFVDKWKYVDKHMVDEFKVHKVVSNDEEIIIGWKEKGKGWELKGPLNQLYIRTVGKDPNVLKGLYLNDIIYEESGENSLLEDTIAASEDCMKFGAEQFGSAWIYGTGGKMDKGSKGFKEIHHNLDNFNAEEYYIPAKVFFHPFYAGATNAKGENIERIPNLQHLKPHERVGMSDLKAAEQYIQKEKEKLLQAGNMEKYFKFCQNNPSSIEEIFRKTSANNFNHLAMNTKLYDLDAGMAKMGKFVLSYKIDKGTGLALTPLEIEVNPATNNTPIHDVVMIHNEGHPIRSYRFLDVAGLDSYDQDQSRTSKSLGAMVVFRRTHSIPELPGWLPVALIRCRPPKKEQFYEMCLKLAIYYGLTGSVLVDLACAMVMKHFEEHGFKRLLSARPKKFESPNTKQVNELGVSLNTYSLPKMLSLLQTFFDYHSDKVEFKDILEEGINYEEYEVDSDNDTIDALGIALMKALDMDHMPPVAEDDLEKADFDKMPEWTENKAGELVMAAANGFGKENKFDPNQEDLFSYLARNMIAEEIEDNDNDPSFIE